MNALPKDWHKIVRKYAKPDAAKAWWQLANSVIPYFLLWWLMTKTIHYSYLLTALLALLAAGFLVRIFIIFHDCGHGSFFKSKKLNEIVGVLTGFLSITPFHKWTYEHKIHHQTVGNLDKRGMGDVYTMTVEEYKNSSPMKRFLYRLMRNPWFLFFAGGFFNFILINKIPKKGVPRKYNIYAVLTLVAFVAVSVVMCKLIGTKEFLFIQGLILYFASIFGVFLFYVQHQYSGVVWERQENWDYATIAYEGSSYLKLPKILQFFSGNIGFHHIHHLSPKIPNYNLERCMNENPVLQKEPLTLGQSLKQMNLRLWDEKKHKLVGFKEAMEG